MELAGLVSSLLSPADVKTYQVGIVRRIAAIGDLPLGSAHLFVSDPEHRSDDQGHARLEGQARRDGIDAQPV